MAKPDKADKPNKGQNKIRTFVNDAGETVTGTMAEWHATLKAQGYRQVEEVETPDEPVEPVAPVGV